MIRQDINLYKCDWDVVIYYDARPSDADTILDELWDMDCPRSHMFKAERLLRRGSSNEGLAYSYHKLRKSLIVIGYADDMFQFLNSLSHEKQHLEQAICEAERLNPYGEDIAYISGYISESIARNAYYIMRKIFLYLL